MSVFPEKMAWANGMKNVERQMEELSVNDEKRSSGRNNGQRGSRSQPYGNGHNKQEQAGQPKSKFSLIFLFF